MSFKYVLEVPSDYRSKLAVVWFWLAVLTLLGAGIFAVLLVLARTPTIGELIPFVDFFHTGLVIHVNLSSLVWILSFASVLWTLNSRPIFSWVAKSSFAIVLTGTLIIVISPFLGSANALMSNYIPVLDDTLFLTGLVIFAAGIGLQVTFSMSAMFKVGEEISGQGVIRFGLNCAAIGVFVALAAFIWSYVTLPIQLANEVYYELLFWSGGHVLQFTYTLLMMVAWLWLSSSAGLSLPLSPRVALFLFGVGLLSIFMTPLVYYAYDVTDVSHRETFTMLMSFGGSLAIFPLSMAVLLSLFQIKPESPIQSSAHTALLTSLLLFGVGGIMGFMIDGNNVKIPAHYHGCIVGVSLALMGLSYQLLDALGFKRVNFKLSKIQLWLYAAGQFLHIAGLVWSGGYGVQRKVAGAAQGLDSIERIAGMGLMGLGGLLSVIGGFFFIMIVLKALLNKKDDHMQNNNVHSYN
ncbi:MAG: cytochrome C oxidase subunit I [Proteobacteria bacterium]|nr:cytochrome C oxidase subunit I [Pseudomonadota bacterium]NOG61556.1 cytochrome C oxidase subunit I [Pseudomonadota bacterium]